MIRVLLAVVLALALALGWALWRSEVHKGDAEAADVRAEALAEQVDSLTTTLEAERAKTERMAAVAVDHERNLTDAQDRADRLAGQLAAGERRVRHEIAALHTARLSEGAAASRELDAAAQRGAELVAAAVGVGARCDAVQSGLIQAYEVNR